MIIVAQLEIAIRTQRIYVHGFAHLAGFEHFSRCGNMMVVSELRHAHERIVNILICQGARLEMRLCLVRVNPVRLDCVGVDARAHVQFVSNDDERDIWVICCRLKCIFPFNESFIRVAS